MWTHADSITRADATIAAQATGAMSWAFITALRKNPQQSYVQLLNSIRDELASKYSQRPQLSSSHPLSELHNGHRALGTAVCELVYANKILYEKIRTSSS